MLRAGRSSEAARYFDEAIAAMEDFPLALHNRGLCDYLSKDLEGAVTWFQRSLQHQDSSSNTMAYNNMGIALRDLGRQAEAVVAFDRARKV